MPLDKWWVIKSKQEAGIFSDEIIQLLKDKVLPELNTYNTTEDLANSWRLKKSSGLTEYQKSKYLKIWEDHKDAQ
jgi:hypothetical protein